MRINLIFLIVIGNCWNTSALAQKDSLALAVGMYASYASQPYQPLWLISNRYGLLPDNQVGVTLTLATKYHLKLKPFTLESRAVMVGSFLAGQYWAQELYAKIKFNTWNITGGKEKTRIGEVDSLLSSGSLAMSGNASPIPKVGIRSNDFIPIPIWQWPWLQLKFSWLHGWMGQERVVKGAYLHEKSLYFRIGKEKLNFYAGMAHFASWGGRLPQGPLPNRFQDYLRIIVGAPQKSQNAYSGLGDHMGILDLGVNYCTSQFNLRFYTQSIYERGYVPHMQEPAKNKGLMILSRDRLVGLYFQMHKKYWINHAALEYINTQHQGGQNATNGKFNYYNDATYSSGWTYHNRIIGTPLFISREQALRYFGSEDNLSGWSITCNRVKGLHLGLYGYLSSHLIYQALITYVDHYGNYYNDALFTPSKRRLNTLIGLSYSISSSLKINFSLAIDRGMLADNEGVLLSLQLHEL